MHHSFLLTNLMSPPILFFILGMLAALLRVDIGIPQSLSRFLSLYLLICLGFQGGIELGYAGITLQALLPLCIAIIISCIIPLYTFFLMRRHLNVYDAAAVAATYGSVGAVAFIAGTNFLEALGYSYDGYMIAALALVESPAIIIALLLVKKYAPGKKSTTREHWLHDAFLNSSVFLIIGSLIIGFFTDQRSFLQLKPFTHDIFKGMLSLFMLDIGILAGSGLQELKKSAVFLTVFAVVAPLINGFGALVCAYFLHISPGDSFLLALISASASYIAVPAALRVSVPQANPGLYLPMSLAVTFPFTILIGMPLFISIIQYFWVL
jgi:hypothetical protein